MKPAHGASNSRLLLPDHIWGKNGNYSNRNHTYFLRQRKSLPWNKKRFVYIVSGSLRYFCLAPTSSAVLGGGLIQAENSHHSQENTVFWMKLAIVFLPTPFDLEWYLHMKYGKDKAMIKFVCAVRWTIKQTHNKEADKNLKEFLQ